MSLSPFPYVHTQTTASGSWTIPHGLGRPANVDVMIDNVIPGITETVVEASTVNGTSSASVISNTIEVTNPVVIYDSFTASGNIIGHAPDVGSTWATLTSSNTMTMDGSLLHPGTTADSLENGVVNNLVIGADFEVVASIVDNRASGESYEFCFIARFNEQNGYGFAFKMFASDVGAGPFVSYGIFQIQSGVLMSFDTQSLDIPSGVGMVWNGNYKLSFKLTGTVAKLYVDSQQVGTIDISTLTNHEMLGTLCGFGISSGYDVSVDEILVYKKVNGVSLSSKYDPADTYMDYIAPQYPNGFSFVNDAHGTWMRVPPGGMLAVLGVDLDCTGDFTVEATLRRSFFIDPFSEGAPNIGLTAFGFGGGFYPVFQFKENQGTTPTGGGLLLYYGTTGFGAVQDETLQNAIIYSDDVGFRFSFYKTGSMLYTAINGHVVSSVDVSVWQVSPESSFYIFHDASSCYNFDVQNLKITSSVSIYPSTDFTPVDITTPVYQEQGPRRILEKMIPSSIVYVSDSEVDVFFTTEQTGIARVF